VTFPQLGLEAVTVLGGMLFSAWTFRRAGREALSRPWSIGSAVFDAGLCTLALATNHFAPGGSYGGVLSSMDVAIAPIVVLTSVLRVSMHAVWASGAAMSLGIAGLVALDVTAGRPPGIDKILLFSVYHCAAIGLALFITQRAREIFGRVGRVASRAENARGSLVALLSDHHDVRSDLCDLQLQIELLGEALDRVPPEALASASSRVAELRERISASMKRVSERTSDTRERALSALEGGGAPVSTDTLAAIRQAVSSFADAHPAPSIQVHVPSELPHVLACGGVSGLSRTIRQLLENAREGDGALGASHVEVSATASGPSRVEISISDNGPGIVAGAQCAPGAARPSFSTKAGSLGIGLRLTESALLAAAGELALENTDKGARVRVILRVVSPSG
jgi:signal transduction histidine kinase